MEKYRLRTLPERRVWQGLRGIARERVAIIRRSYEAWNAGCLDSVSHTMDPCVEVDWSDSLAPYRGVYRGHADWLRLFDQIRSPFEQVTTEPEDFIICGQHIAVPNTARMRGRDGVEVVAHSTLVFTFHGVKVVAMRLFQSEADARAAICAAL
jgi:ketosteroid isomerase-like protein